MQQTWSKAPRTAGLGVLEQKLHRASPIGFLRLCPCSRYNLDRCSAAPGVSSICSYRLLLLGADFVRKHASSPGPENHEYVFDHLRQVRAAWQFHQLAEGWDACANRLVAYRFLGFANGARADQRYHTALRHCADRRQYQRNHPDSQQCEYRFLREALFLPG